jgi:hypothetical protein
MNNEKSEKTFSALLGDLLALERLSGDGMLIITLGSALDITPGQVINQFGEPEISLVESPPGEPIVPKMYYTCRHPGGKVSFGISWESKKVIDVVVDRIKDV